MEVQFYNYSTSVITEENMLYNNKYDHTKKGL